MIGDRCVECSSIPNHFLVEETYVSELISFWVPIWKRDIFFFFVWEGKDNCCLPGYRLISSLLTSGCLAKFTPLPSDLLNNYKTIQAVPIVFYRKALIAWYT